MELKSSKRTDATEILLRQYNAVTSRPQHCLPQFHIVPDNCMHMSDVMFVVACPYAELTELSHVPRMALSPAWTLLFEKFPSAMRRVHTYPRILVGISFALGDDV